MDPKRFRDPRELISTGATRPARALAAPHVVLVVQDDVYARTIERWLSRRAWTITRAPKAASALPWWRSAGADVALLDLDADALGGFALLAAVRRERPTARAVIVTRDAGVARLPDAVKRRLGIADVVVRPCHLEEIAAALGRACVSPPAPADGPAEN